MKALGSEFQINLGRRKDGRDHMPPKEKQDRGMDIKGDLQLVEDMMAEIKKQVLVGSEVQMGNCGKFQMSSRKGKPC